ncbi:MAG: formyltransferase family protein [Acidimicrobiia bacterium]|nr:formyltransferase family protein [Acidimicrobiia bacterium]
MILAAPPASVSRVAYLGTPEVAVPPLRALAEAGFEIPLVVTGVDKRRGRGRDLSPTPVKAAATDLGLPVAHELAALDDVDIDLGVVVAYGKIIPSDVLERVPLVNIHFSLLPRWRGAAPVERALLAGDRETGVCLMVVDEELDTGAVYRSQTVAIDERDTLQSLRERLVDVGAELLVTALRDGLGEPVPQTGEPTYAAKIDPRELEIDWTEPAAVIDRLVRLGGAWTIFRDRRLKVLDAEPVPHGPAPGRLDGLVVGTGQGGLSLTEVQPEGKAAMAGSAWLNGAQPGLDDLLGS